MPTTNCLTLTTAEFMTPLGPMLAVADEHHLYMLEFLDRKNLHPEIKKLKTNLNAAFAPGETTITQSIQSELANYFSGACSTFKTPVRLIGTPFQKNVWSALMKIPLGETRAYATLAKELEKPSAFRAVAMANSRNRLAIIVPCHRVIYADGTLGGYASGIARKKWLLTHETSYCNKHVD